MTPNPDTQAIDVDVFEMLMRDVYLFGFHIHRVNEDGTWTRIAPEDFYLSSPDHDASAPDIKARAAVEGISDRPAPNRWRDAS